MTWKKRLLSLLLLVFAGPLLAEEQALFINKFGGLDSDTDPLLMSQEMSPDSANVVTDEGAGLSPRKGFVDFSTTTASQGWTFNPSNGTKYHIIREEGTLKASTGNGIYDITISTVASDRQTAGSQLGDRWYFANTSDGLKYWDMSTVTSASSTLTVDILTTHKGRLLAAGHPDFPRTIFLSKYVDGTVWTATTNADDQPAQIELPTGERISAVYAPFADMAIVFQSNSFYGLYGSRRSTFGLRTYSGVVGTAYPGSVRDCDGLLRFLGPRRTVWEFNGSSYVKISEPIDTLMGTLAQGDANLRAFTFTTETDFNTGTNFQTSNGITSGSVLLSSAADTDTTAADFNAGTASNTTVIGNSVYLSTNNTNVNGNSFEESGCFGTAWTQTLPTCASGFTTPCETSTCYSGSQCLALCSDSSPGSVRVEILDMSGNVLSTNDYSGNGPGVGTYTQRTISLASYAGKWLKVRFSYTTGSGNATSEPFLCSGGDLTFYHTGATFSGDARIDLLEGGRSTTFSGTFTSSPAFNTGFTPTTWLSSDVTASSNSHSITYQTEASADGSTWDSLVSWTPGTAPTSAGKQYIRYTVTMSTGGTTNGTALPHVDDVTLAARASTGTWVSPAIDMSDISSWGSFTEDTTLDGASVSFAVYTDTDTNITLTNGIPQAASFISSQTITDGAIPSISTNAYARVASFFSITNESMDPLNNDIGIQWNEGQQLPVPAAWINQRYWLPMARNSTTNNFVLVYDKNRQWQQYTGINADFTNVYSADLLFGNSGGIFKAETGYNDDSSDIEAYYKTRDFPLAGMDKKFYLNEAYITTAEGLDTMGLTYFVNGRASGTALGSVDMTEEDGIQNRRVPIAADGVVQQAKATAFKFSVNATTFWRLLNTNFYFRPKAKRD